MKRKAIYLYKNYLFVNQMESDLSDNEDHYDSDAIDPDIEVSLYGVLHHHFNNDIESNSLITTESDERRRPEVSILNHQNSDQFMNFNDINKTDENLNECKNRNNCGNKRSIECIQIEDSEDSDVVIIEDNLKKKSKKCKVKKLNKSKRRKSSAGLDISLGNVNNLLETTVSRMDQFYNEDVYDSEEELEAIKQMSNDSSMWRISRSDVLLSNRKGNRYYKSKIICNNCSERGHIAKDCSLAKKSPICYLCGVSGHKTERCKSIICSKCFSLTHKTYKCDVLVNQLICDECGRRGHDTNQCTHNWRKYHMTTTANTEPVFTNIKINKRISCFNCGVFHKHFGHECRSKAISFCQMPSPLMVFPKTGHCFNERDTNRSDHSINKRFLESISSNELGSCSASFDNTLSEFDSIQNSIITTSYNNQNKHIKWIYPKTNSTPIRGSFRRNEISTNNTISDQFNDSDHSTALHNDILSNTGSAHTRTHTEINNSMLEKSQTTPKRSKRKNRHKGSDESHQLLRETNISPKQISSRRKRNKPNIKSNFLSIS